MFTLENTARATGALIHNGQVSFLILKDDMPSLTLNHGEWYKADNTYIFDAITSGGEILKLSRPESDIVALFEGAPEWATGYASCEGTRSTNRFWIGKNKYSLSYNQKYDNQDYLFGAVDDDGVNFTLDYFTIIATRPESKAHESPALIDEDSDRCKIRRIGDILHNMSCSMSDENEQSEFGEYASFCWGLGDYLGAITVAGNAIEPVKEVKEVKPVFTQAMYDAGEPIKTGMAFTTETGGEYFAELVNDKSVCFTDEDGHLVAFSIGWPLPIDQRTDKEKAIHKIDKIITKAYQEATDSFISDTRFKSEATALFNEIIDGEIHGVKWVGK